MLVLGIYGSPRRKGNTDLMLDAFLAGAAADGAEIQRLYVRDLDIRGCLGCGHCDKAGFCIQQDAMVQVYPLLEQATHIVVAAPIYFYGVPGQLKLLVDRSQALFMKKLLAAEQGQPVAASPVRKGFLLSAGATRGKRIFECAILTMRYFYDALAMSYAGELCFRKVEERGAIKAHPSALEECRRAGRAFLQTT